ncbi:MAG: hypothetical protein J5898_04075, partial [Lachnospiraceae bacterium]|nr:hypothetical protein [Lachnospiraceae bacterium]
MDKVEYKYLVEQIKSLIEQKEYAEAVVIADRIDWRRVRSVMMLGTISDLYKINCRYEDARDIMLLAYERRPENRQICYSLCELYIKTGEMVEAVEFYKEFVQLAPKDPGRYILQYKLYEANEVSLEERIEVLEELKKHEYQEKWMYELAYLYHRLGLATKCVEVCDELILWFGTGKYVNKAMELKMLHEELTPEQKKRYENRFAQTEQENLPDQYEENDVQYDGQEEAGVAEYTDAVETAAQEGVDLGATRVFDVDEVRRRMRGGSGEDELDIQVKTVDVGEYNTMNLQAEIAAGLREVLDDDAQPAGMHEYSYQDADLQQEPIHPVTRAIMAPMMDADTGALDMPAIEEIDENDLEPEPETVEGSEIYFGATGELYQDASGYFYETAAEPDDAGKETDLPGEAAKAQSEEAIPAEMSGEKQGFGEFSYTDISHTEYEQMTMDFVRQDDGAQPQREKTAEVSIADQVMEQMRRESMSVLEQEAMTAQPPEPMAKVLTQESDGQIRLVIPESRNLEKQITGQISIEDIRAEWERMKREKTEENEEEVRQEVLRQTGKMFTKFEEAIRDNILKKMEEGKNAPIPGVDLDQAVQEEINEFAVSKEEDLPEIPEQMQVTEEESAEVLEVGEAGEEYESLGEDTEEVSSAVMEESEEEEAGESLGESTEEEPSEVMEESEAEEAYESLGESTEEESSEIVEESEAEEAYESLGESTEEESSEVVEESEAEEAYESLGEVMEEEPLEVLEENVAGDAYEPLGESEEEISAGREPEEQAVAASIAAATVSAASVKAENVNVPLPQDLESDWDNEDIILTDEESPAAAQPVREEVPADTVAAAHQQPAAGEQSTAGGQTVAEALFGEEPEDYDEENYASEETDEDAAEEAKGSKVRALTKDETELYGSLVQGKAAREQLVKAIDNISLAAYTGNVIITGEPGMDTLALAKNMIYEVKQSDSNFSGKVAKLSGQALNTRNVDEVIDGLNNGALIIQKAGDLEPGTLEALYRSLQKESFGIIVVLLDSRKRMRRLLQDNGKMQTLFT